MEGVWIAPVTAHVMMTLRAMDLVPLGRSLICLRLLVGFQRSQAFVSPRRAPYELIGSRRFAPGLQYAAHILLVPDMRPSRIFRETPIEACIAVTVIGDATGCVQLD